MRIDQFPVYYVKKPIVQPGKEVYISQSAKSLARHVPVNPRISFHIDLENESSVCGMSIKSFDILGDEGKIW